MRLTPIPALVDNYIWLLDDGISAIAVDPGEARPLLDELAARGLKLGGILLTHHHPDHVAGSNAVLRVFPEARVFAPRDPRIEIEAQRVAEGDEIRFESPDAVFTVIEVPGHTTSHVAYVGADVLFCGDTLFSLGCGRMFEGTPAQFCDSLSRLAALPGDTLVCCGHEYTVANGHFARLVDPGNDALAGRIGDAKRLHDKGVPTVPSRMGDECATNPFLRRGTRDVVEALMQRHGRPPANEVEAFAWLRAWKDEYRVPA